MPEYDFKAIKAVLASPPGQELKRYLRENLVRLRDIESVLKAEDPVHQAVQFNSHLLAYEVLKEILMHIADLEEPATVKEKESFAPGI